MSGGRILYEPPEKKRPHHCGKPKTSDWIDYPDGTYEHVFLVRTKTVWQCNCGRIWRWIYNDWYPAPFWIRWRYRKEKPNG